MVSGDNISARSALGPAVDLTGGGSDAGGSTLTTSAEFDPWDGGNLQETSIGRSPWDNPKGKSRGYSHLQYRALGFIIYIFCLLYN